MRYAIVLALLLAGCERGEKTPAAGSNRTMAAAPASVVNEAGQTSQHSAAGTDSGERDVSACLVQDGEQIPDNALRAIGTEPFWGASVEGRCVTYSTPEDQDGTRVWTRFEGSAERGRWTGALDGRRFVMATEPQPGCFDGMSDNLYPIAVTLVVRGEQRRGCAEPR